MKKLWAFVRKPQNLAVLAAIGAVLAFSWSEFIAPLVKRDAAPTQGQTAQAKGGTAINASGNSQVAVGGPAPQTQTAPDQAAAPCPQGSGTQRAEAEGSGIAVNADCSARVSVNTTPAPQP